MRDSLIEYYTFIFENLHIKSTFEVYGCGENELPIWARKFAEFHNYIVICQLNLLDKNNLEKELRIKILKYEDWCYWFYNNGSLTLSISKTCLSKKLYFIPSVNSPNNIVLPEWLDSYLFNNLNAKYAPDHTRYEYNLDLIEDEVRTYLGTYFPRSFAESFCIFDNLFSNSKYKSLIENKKKLSILDFGCGTGGEIVGLLSAITKHMTAIENVRIFAIDGNQEALRQLNKIINRFKSECLFTIEFNVGAIPISDCSDVEIINEIISDSFDFILSFKAICELISKQRIKNNAYKYIAEILSPKLVDNGLLLLLDVTIKNNITDTFYPILLNNGITSFVKKAKEYKSLVPLSCYFHETVCIHDCFTQCVFTVTHSRKNRDVSKVSYRIIGYKDFVDAIIPINFNSKYILQVKGGKNIYCPYSNGEISSNTYDLKF